MYPFLRVRGLIRAGQPLCGAAFAARNPVTFNPSGAPDRRASAVEGMFPALLAHRLPDRLAS
jgi:hypothetical protein